MKNIFIISVSILLLCSFSNAWPETSAGPPKPLWQTKLNVQETDFIEFMSKDRVLVGTIDDSDLGGGLKPHEIILLNSATGETVWAVPRSSYGSHQTLMDLYPVILIEGSRQYVALNPENGTQIWSRERAGDTSLLLNGRDLVVFLNRKASPMTLSAVNAKTGSEAWKTPIENYPVDKKTRLDVTTVGDVVLLSGPEVAAFSASAGKSLWRMPFPGTFEPNPAAIPLGDDLYFSDGSTITRSDPTSGKQIWHSAMSDGTFQALTANERSVFILLKGSGEKPPDSIAALDRNTGKQLWKSDLMDRAASPINIVGDRLYVTTPANVIALNALDGSVAFKSEIPSNLQSRKQLPDNLRIASDRIIVAREDGVLAVRKSDGKLLFADQVPGGIGFTYDYATNRFRHATSNALPRTKKHPFPPNPDSTSPDDNYRVATAQQQAVFEQFRAYTQAPMTNQLNMIKDATTSHVPGQQSQYIAPRAAMAGYAAVGGIYAAAAILNAVWVNRRVDSYQERVQHTFQTHANSLQEKFYVRPSYEQHRGWSLHAVNLETGDHADILLSSDGDVTPNGFAANLPAFSTYGSQIVSKGLGVSPERVEKKKGLWFHEEVAYPSVLAFDFASARFEPCAKSPVPAAKPADSGSKTPDEELLAAAYENDVEAARKSLDAGANVNGVNEYGVTPLMLAAEASAGSKNADVVKLLLAHGAGPNVRDPGGLTALEHANLLASISTKGMLSAIKLITKAQKEHK